MNKTQIGKTKHMNYIGQLMLKRTLELLLKTKAKMRSRRNYAERF